MLLKVCSIDVGNRGADCSGISDDDVAEVGFFNTISTDGI